MPLRFQFLMSALLLWLSGCSTQQRGTASADLALLPADSSETSGLICRPQGFLSVNDSGNPAELQQLDPQLKLTRTPLSLTNTDWEALATDGDTVFIADTGNNSGQRTELQIHSLNFNADTADVDAIQTLRLRYARYPAQAPAPYQHDFDAEALAYAEGSLWLFSKSWQSGISQVYQIDPQQTDLQTLDTTEQISGLPGVVTDAVYIPQLRVFVLTGYQNYLHQLFRFALQGQFDAFAAVTDQKFKLLQLIPLPHAGQLEGICARDNQIWLSQEQSEHHPARLWREPRIEAALEKLTSE